MMKNNIYKNAQDFRKSLEARLQKVTKEKGTDLQRVRRKVAFDRLLARFFAHPEPPFFLKGGYAMELRLSSARATKDIDLTYLQRTQSQSQDKMFSSFILDDLRRLAAADLDDYFLYTVGDIQLDLDNAPYGGARYPISSFIDGKLFVKFHLDVGGDIAVSSTETLITPDWLNFCGVPAASVKMISIEQQFAEKIHAYTLPRGEKSNSRVKDVIDVLLLIRMRPLDLDELSMNLHKVFKIRNTHDLPLQLLLPPLEWNQPYLVLAEGCDLEKNLSLAFQEISSLYYSLFKRLRGAVHL